MAFAPESIAQRRGGSGLGGMPSRLSTDEPPIPGRPSAEESQVPGRPSSEASDAPAGLPRPMAAIEVVVEDPAVEDEITVIGQRRPRTVVTIDREIESTTMDFYNLLNEVVAAPEFQVDCEWGTSEERGVESMIRRRYCYAGYQIEDLRLMMEARESAQEVEDGEADVAFVYEPDQRHLAEMEQKFAEVIMAAMAEYPALAVAGEKLVGLHSERAEMTGGAPALDAHARERERARAETRGGGRR
jgi:hypothetical protein